MKIAFLGAGLMGTGFVRRALDNGLEVNVWNRNAQRAQALQPHGAKAFDDAAAAVRGVDRVHLSLADDASVDAVLEPMAKLIGADTPVIDHTTTAPTPTRDRAARWSARGQVFVHAPVFMSPAHCYEGGGVMLLCGDKARCDALSPELQKMTGRLVYLGAAPDRAAAFKLFGNLTLIGLSGVIGDVVRLAQACNIAPAEAVALYNDFNPGQTLASRAEKITGGPYEPPSFEVAMARKDVRLMIEEAHRHGFDLQVMPAVAALYDAAIARGEGHLDASAAMRPRPKG